MEQETLEYGDFLKKYNYTWNLVKAYPIVPPYRATSRDWEPDLTGTNTEL